MTVELFRAVTPFVTFFLVLVVGVIGFFLKWMLSQNERGFRELKDKIDELERKIREVDLAHVQDQKDILRNYVTSETFYMAVGKNEAIAEKIFSHLNDLSSTLNQYIGAFKVLQTREKKNG